MNGAVGDINSYADDLLIDLLDGTCDENRPSLQRVYGDRRLTEGVERRLCLGAPERLPEMRSSPTTDIGMGNADDGQL